MSDLNPRKLVTKQPSCVEVGECRPSHRSRKDRRQWCKGRVGVPHTWEWQRSRHQLEMLQRVPGLVYSRIAETPVCFGCGKRDRRARHYCAACGTPWTSQAWWADSPCPSCGVPAMARAPRAVSA